MTKLDSRQGQRPIQRWSSLASSRLHLGLYRQAHYRNVTVGHGEREKKASAFDTRSHGPTGSGRAGAGFVDYRC